MSQVPVVSLALSSCVLAFTLSWLILAKQQFLYPFWHDTVGIAQGIEKYGPQNRFKVGFADTTRAQRIELFAQINDSVHNHGEGLAEIHYESATSRGPQTLLRDAEVVHLQDVAILIDLLKKTVAINAILWFILVVTLLKKRQNYIRLAKQCGGVGMVLSVVTVLVLVLGPVKVFNQLHIWVFPDEHQWFFYYQDSLMSTMMLAPRLFGWIAIVLAAVGVVMFITLTSILQAIERHIKCYREMKHRD